MFHFRFNPGARVLSTALLAIALFGCASSARAQTQRAPADVVREFYKAMREHRFKDAFYLTIYKPAVEGLSAEEMEDLRPGFEDRASQIPEQVEITGEQITGNTATVFVKVSVNESTPQSTSQPVSLIKSGGAWIIGTEADQAEVKKKGHRFFLDALITQNQSDMEDLLRRVIAVQVIYSQQHGGAYGDLAALINTDQVSKDAGDPKILGYNFRVTVGTDGKSYQAAAVPTRYGRTGKLSYLMDQTGTIKSVDNGGKPFGAK